MVAVIAVDPVKHNLGSQVGFGLEQHLQARQASGVVDANQQQAQGITVGECQPDRGGALLPAAEFENACAVAGRCAATCRA